MRTVTVHVLLGFVAACASRGLTESMESTQELWDQFKSKFNRNYSVEEEKIRFGNFLQTLKLIDVRNAAEISMGGTSIHGITKFADLSQKEFEQKFLSTLGSKPANIEKAPKRVYMGSDSNVDWTGVLTTPVKDQGECAAGWAFAATEQIESDLILTAGVDTSFTLSTQQVTSCARGYGCGYGWTEYAFEYVREPGGIEREEDYPFTSGRNGRTGSCNATSSNYAATLIRYYQIEADINASHYTLSIETNMAEYVKSTGPLAVCVFPDNWSTYTGGIMLNCGENEVNHCKQDDFFPK